MRDRITNLTQKFPTEFATEFANRFPTEFPTGSASDVAARFTNDAAAGFERNSDRVLDAVVDANRRLVEFTVTTVDRVADVLGEQFSIELPFADKMPTPAATGERYLDFVERAVSVNRDFNERIVSMLTADAPTVAKTPAAKTAPAATAPVAKTAAPKAPAATKAAARKPAARKTAARKPAARKTTARKVTAAK